MNVKSLQTFSKIDALLCINDFTPNDADLLSKHIVTAKKVSINFRIGRIQNRKKGVQRND